MKLQMRCFMNVISCVPEIKQNLTTEQRLDLILDLTRRVDLLEDLLKTAREKWHLSDDGTLQRPRSC